MRFGLIDTKQSKVGSRHDHDEHIIFSLNFNLTLQPGLNSSYLFFANFAVGKEPLPIPNFPILSTWQVSERRGMAGASRNPLAHCHGALAQYTGP